MSANNGYPFVTKAMIRMQIRGDFQFAGQCLGIIFDRQTADEQKAKTTKFTNRMGFSKAQSKRGSELALAFRAGDYSQSLAIVEMALHYVDQITHHFREVMLESNPELAAKAKVFGV